MKKISIILMTAISLGLVSCSTESILPEPESDPIVKPEPEPEPTPSPSPTPSPTPSPNYKVVTLTDAQGDAVVAQNDFGMKMFKAIAKINKGNVAFSPLSMNALLSMISNGVSGKTLSEIAGALGVDDDETGVMELNKLYRLLIDELSDMDCDFNLAGAAFSTEQYGTPTGDFLPTIAQWYDAEYTKVAHESEMQAKVNEWINGKTNGMIPEFGIPSGSNSVLANAMYFACKWRYGMNECEDKTLEFVNYDKTKSTPEFIEGYGDASRACDGYDVVYKYLGKANSNFVMELVLPHDGVDIDEFVATFDPETSSLNGEEGVNNTKVAILTMPKFKVNFDTHELNNILESVGINKLFSSPYDVEKKGLTSAGIFAENISQKVAIELDENGVKAASASGLSGGGSTWQTPEYIYYIFDCPFVFVLREVSTDAILMTGVIRKL